MGSKASEESDNLANVSNVSLKDIKEFIVKYRTLPIINKAQSEAEKFTKLVNNSDQNNQVDNTNENNNYVNNQEYANRNIYNSRANARYSHLKQEYNNEEDMDINDNAYHQNIMTNEHRDLLEKVVQVMGVLERKTDVATELVAMKETVVKTINQHLERNNRVIDTAYQKLSQEIFQGINAKLEVITKQKTALSDSLGTIANIDKALLEVKQELNDYKTVVDNVRKDYAGFNDKLIIKNEDNITSLNKENAYYKRENAANTQRFIAAQEANAISSRSQNAILSEMSGFLSIINASIADSKISLDTLKKDNSLALATRSELIPEQPKFDIGSLTSQLGKVIKGLFEKERKNHPVTNLIELINNYEDALKMITHNQTLAVVRSGEDRELINSVKLNNTNILHLSKSINDHIRSEQLAIEGRLAIEAKPKEYVDAIDQPAIEGSAGLIAIEGLSKQLALLVEVGRTNTDNLLAIQANQVPTKKQNDAIEFLMKQIHKIMDGYTLDLRSITDGYDSREVAIRAEQRAIASTLNKYEPILSGAVNLGIDFQKLANNFSEGITKIQEHSNSQMLAIENGLAESIANVNRSFESKEGQTKALYTALMKVYQEQQQQQQTAVTPEKMIEYVGGMLDQGFARVQSFLTENLALTQGSVGAPDEFSMPLTSQERGETTQGQAIIMGAPSTTLPINPIQGTRLEKFIREKTFSAIAIINNSDTSSLPAATDMSLIEEDSPLESFKDAVIKAVNDSRGIDDVKRQTIIEEINDSNKKGRFFDLSIVTTMGVRLTTILPKINRYNSELISHVDDKRIAMLKEITTTDASEDYVLRLMGNFTYEFMALVNSIKSKTQLRNLSAVVKAPIVGEMNLQGTPREAEVSFQAHLMNAAYRSAEKELSKTNGIITNNSAPAATTSSELISSDNALPPIFVTNNLNQKIIMYVNEVTNNTTVLDTAMFAIEPVPQQDGGQNGGPLEVKENVKKNIQLQARAFVFENGTLPFDSLTREDLTALGKRYQEITEQMGDEPVYNDMERIRKLLDKRHLDLQASELQYPSNATYNPPVVDVVEETPKEDLEETQTSIMSEVDRQKDFVQRRKEVENEKLSIKRQMQSLVPIHSKIRSDANLEPSRRELAENAEARTKHLSNLNFQKKKKKGNQGGIDYFNKKREKDGEVGQGIRRRNMHREIESSKEEIKSNKEYAKNSREFLNNEGLKRKHKLFKGYGVHKSLEFRKKLINLIKSGRVSSKRGEGVSKKLVCSLCNNDKKDNDYHMTKSKEVLHKKCFEGKGMTRKRKLYDEDYGEDITADSSNPKLREMHESDSNAKQNEIMDTVKLNNVHNDHMQSIAGNSLLNLITRSKHGYVAWGSIDSTLFSLLCHLLSVFNNNKDNASGWDYINYQVLRSKYLLSVKPNPKKIKYIDIDTSNLQSVEKSVKANPEILFDYDFNE